MTLHVKAEELSSVPRFKPRENRRQINLPGWFIRDTDQSTHQFSLINLSYSGCRLRTSTRLTPGEQLRMSVQGLGRIEGKVQWQLRDDVGLHFNASTGEVAKKARKEDRHKASLEVLVRRQGRRSQWIDASDVSASGCCLSFVDLPRVGDLIWVQLPGLEPIQSKVRWIAGHKSGVSFDREIHEAVFRLLLARWTNRLASAAKY